MKEETMLKIVNEINDALWDLKHNKCNVDTKEKSWEAYYGLDIELIDYIRKIEQQLEQYKQRNEKAIEYIKEHTNKVIITRIPKIDFDYNELLNILKGVD